MKNTLLIIFVEGLSDELFVQDIVKKRRPDICIKIYKYAKKPKEDIVKYIKALNKMNDNSFTYYLFLADNDSCKYPQQKIDIIIKSYPNIRSENIIIVENEIESWYMAGIDKKACKKLKIVWKKVPAKITKENFQKLIGKRSRFEILPELLSYYSVELGITRSPSLNYFIKKIEELK